MGFWRDTIAGGGTGEDLYAELEETFASVHERTVRRQETVRGRLAELEGEAEVLRRVRDRIPA